MQPQIKQTDTDVSAIVFYAVLLDPCAFDIVSKEETMQLVSIVRTLIDQAIVEVNDVILKASGKETIPIEDMKFDREMFGDIFAASVLSSKKLSEYLDRLNFSTYYPKDEEGYLDKLIVIIDSPFAYLDSTSKYVNEHNFICPAIQNYTIVN